jgi:hypothetical protein
MEDRSGKMGDGSPDGYREKFTEVIQIPVRLFNVYSIYVGRREREV